MAEDTPLHDDALAAELNDLRDLDRDAIAAYDVAIDHLRSEAFRSTLRAFRADRERHISDLARLLERLGGTAERAPGPTGAFELAVRETGGAGGDREVLLAFKAHEARARDHYRRAAAVPRDPDVETVLRRNAADEERHYAWVTQALEALGVGHAAAAWTEPLAEAPHAAAPEAAPGTAGPPAVREAAQDVVVEIRERASDLGERAMAAASGGLEGAARAVGRAAGWAEARGGAARRAVPPAYRVADALQQAAGNLRAQDLEAIREDVESEVVRHPIRSVLIAAGIGYVVGRLLR